MKRRKCIHCGRLRWTRQKQHLENALFSVGCCLTCTKRAKRKMRAVNAGRNWYGRDIQYLTALRGE